MAVHTTYWVHSSRVHSVTILVSLVSQFGNDIYQEALADCWLYETYDVNMQQCDQPHNSELMLAGNTGTEINSFNSKLPLKDATQ